MMAMCSQQVKRKLKNQEGLEAHDAQSNGSKEPS